MELKRIALVIGMALALSGCAELTTAREPAPQIGHDRNDLKESPCACNRPVIRQQFGGELS